MKKRPEDIADLQNLLCLGGRLLFESEEGRIVSDGEGGTIFSDISDGAALCRALAGLKNGPGADVRGEFLVKSMDAAAAVQREYGLRGMEVCTQLAYTLDTAPAYAGDIRPLTEKELPTAQAHYGLMGGGAYIAGRIAAGRVWGLFEGECLLGFIGVHDGGGMGMLEVLPEHRRRGAAYALEAFLIGWHLQRGMTPYCQVVRGNAASMALQKKLGLVESAYPAIWLW